MLFRAAGSHRSRVLQRCAAIIKSHWMVHSVGGGGRNQYCVQAVRLSYISFRFLYFSTCSIYFFYDNIQKQPKRVIETERQYDTLHAAHPRSCASSDDNQRRVAFRRWQSVCNAKSLQAVAMSMMGRWLGAHITRRLQVLVETEQYLKVSTRFLSTNNYECFVFQTAFLQWRQCALLLRQSAHYSDQLLSLQNKMTALNAGPRRHYIIIPASLTQPAQHICIHTASSISWSDGSMYVVCLQLARMERQWY